MVSDSLESNSGTSSARRLVCLSYHCSFWDCPLIKNLHYYLACIQPAHRWSLLQHTVSGKTYRIKQDLICNLDNSAARRGEVLLSITYHFVPIKSGAPDSRQQASLRGSASPSSSSSASTPLSASPGSSMHASLQPHQPHALTHGGQMQMQLPMHAQASVMRGIAQPPMRSSMAPQSMTIGRELTPADMVSISFPSLLSFR